MKLLKHLFKAFWLFLLRNDGGKKREREKTRKAAENACVRIRSSGDRSWDWSVSIFFGSVIRSWRARVDALFRKGIDDEPVIEIGGPANGKTHSPVLQWKINRKTVCFLGQTVHGPFDALSINCVTRRKINFEMIWCYIPTKGEQLNNIWWQCYGYIITRQYNKRVGSSSSRRQMDATPTRENKGRNSSSICLCKPQKPTLPRAAL